MWRTRSKFAARICVLCPAVIASAMFLSMSSRSCLRARKMWISGVSYLSRSEAVNGVEDPGTGNELGPSEEWIDEVPISQPPIPPERPFHNELRNGAWILDPDLPHAGHILDAPLCKALEVIFRDEDVLDLGAGVGYYGKFFLRKKDPIVKSSPEADSYFYSSLLALESWWHNSSQLVKSWTGYDGSPNIDTLTNGFVKYLDLTVPQNLSQRWDWVLSIEVGEHVPKMFQDTYIENLVRHAKKGLVISWAVGGQTGDGHVNNLDNQEVVELMKGHGFHPVDELWRFLRNGALFAWFKRSVMVFAPDSVTGN